MIPFRLIGGPFDGAEGEGLWDKVPEVLWARHDPNSPGPHKGVVNIRQRPGAVAYGYAEEKDGTYCYVLSNVSDVGWMRLVEQIGEPVAA